MDADQIRRLRPELTRYLKQFESCFARRDTWAYFPIYVEGQLSDLREKSCEPMALGAGLPPRNLQEFLAHYKWDEDLTRNRLHELVVRRHSGPNSIGIIDETSDVKKGDKTPGVKRQWCGTVGCKRRTFSPALTVLQDSHKPPASTSWRKPWPISPVRKTVDAADGTKD